MTEMGPESVSNEGDSTCSVDVCGKDFRNVPGWLAQNRFVMLQSHCMNETKMFCVTEVVEGK